jgi:nitrous oxidase accessory protein NosD
MRRRSASLLLLLPFLGCSSPDDASPPSRSFSPDRDDIDIAANSTATPGSWTVPDPKKDGVIRVAADDVTLDLSGVVLSGSPEGTSPDSFEGIAVLVESRRNVTIRGGAFRGFRCAVYLKNCEDCVVEAADVSDNRAQRLKSTPTRCEDGSDWLAPHVNDRNEWLDAYGAGVYLDGCRRCVVRGCAGRRTQNGIVLRNTADSLVADNDMSWMSGWGLAMWRSSRNEISRNRFDWCVRGYSFGVYDRGQDSAGILMFEQCSDNLVAMNSATHGGDGIFIYAGHETTQRTGTGGCNRNLLWRNDFSHAVANAIECTFSEGNRFVENTLDDSNYGVWAGYSYGTKIVANTCRDARVAGVAIEHGHDNLIEGNVFERCFEGVQLWWDEDADFANSPYGKTQNTRSERTLCALNRFARCRTAARVGRSSEIAFERNEFAECDRLAELEGPCPAFRFEFNRISGRPIEAVKNGTGGDVEIGANHWTEGKPENADGVAYALGPTSLKLDLKALSHREPAPDFRGSQDPFLPKNARRGMRTIVVDEWGPCDPSVPKIFPARQCAGSEAEFHVFGPEGTFAVERVEGDVAVSPVEGRSPGVVRVRAAAVPRAGVGTVAPFSFHVRTSAGAKLSASGLIVAASWTVRIWSWQGGDGEHGGFAKALDEIGWSDVLASRPIMQKTLPGLRRPWLESPVPPNYFADQSRALIEFPAGKWRFTTTSDDGVRVRVDGKVVIDNWTWHPPATDTAVVEMEKGVHEVVVEHFEIDGHEELELEIEPAG